MNTLTYTHGISRCTMKDKNFDEHSKPYLSFQYDELFYTPQRKTYILQQKEFILNKNKISEIESYIDTIEKNYTSLEQKRKDISAKSSMQEYLNNTDWMVIREMETGKKTPPHIKEQRQKAREKIHTLKKEAKI